MAVETFEIVINREILRRLYSRIYEEILHDFLPDEKLYKYFISSFEHRIYYDIRDQNKYKTPLSPVEKILESIIFHTVNILKAGVPTAEFKDINQRYLSKYIREYYEWVHHIPLEYKEL